MMDEVEVEVEVEGRVAKMKDPAYTKLE